MRISLPESLPLAYDKDQGRRVMEPGGSIQGRSTPESLRGLCRHSLTLGITRGTPARRREGFTDLSRLLDGIAPTPGNVTYPTRNFA